MVRYYSLWSAGLFQQPVKQIKSELFRLCRIYGTRIDVLDAWGVPAADAEILSKRLLAMQVRWDQLADQVVQHWDGWVNEWANENPEYREEIHRLAPTIEQVKKKTKFVFASYRLTPEQIESGSLEGEFDILHEQALHEIGAQVRELYPDIDGDSWGIKTFRAVSARNLLQTIARKAQGFAWLHPRLAEIPSVLHALLAQLPHSGTIDGLQAIGLRSVLEQLTKTRFVMNHGILIPQGSSTEEPEENEEPVPVIDDIVTSAQPAVVLPITRYQASSTQVEPVLTGTYDF